MDPVHLKEILHQHSLWLKNPAEGKRADLRGADLREAHLSGAVLSGAVLSGAVLYGARFTVELNDVKNLEGIKYGSEQFSWLSLNPVFLESV